MLKLRLALFLRTKILLAIWLLSTFFAVLVAETVFPHHGGTLAALVMVAIILLYLRPTPAFARRVALHEAAHAVIGWRHPSIPDVVCVVAGPKNGMTEFVDCGPLHAKDAATLNAFVVMLLAGIAAELRAYGLPCAGTFDDLNRSEYWASHVAMKSRVSSDYVLDAALNQAKAEVTQEWARIEQVADLLQERTTLQRTDIEAILGPRPVAAS